MSRTHCSNGHELAIEGTRPDGLCRRCRREYATRYNNALRREVLLAYGDGSCAACGCRPEELLELELDHVNGDGKEHRAAFGHYGAMYGRLRALGWPNDPPLQTLCGPCHRAKTTDEKRRLRAAA
jgi:hypothetical protein